MGAGGVIIIRQKIKQTASLDQVRSCVPANLMPKFDAIMAREPADWTNAEAHFIQQRITRALDDCSSG